MEAEEPARPVWQEAADLLHGAPAEELARLPEDLSENLDHYLYGTPKR